MPFAKDDLIEALRLRYDHYSALSVFELARVRAGLADQPNYEVSELRAWRSGLAAVGDRVRSVLARVDELLASGPASQPTQDVKPREVAKPEPATLAPVAATAGTHSAELIETTIVLTGVDVDDGDQVLVCGGAAALGDWDAERARPLSRAGGEWRTVITIAPRASIAYKFLRRDAAGNVTWEGGDNRMDMAAPRLEAVWR